MDVFCYLFSWIWAEYREIWSISRIQSECVKVWTRKTLNIDTFCAVFTRVANGDDELMMNKLFYMVDRRKAFRFTCQRSSPSRISDTPRAGFEPAQNLSSGFVERSWAVEKLCSSFDPDFHRSTKIVVTVRFESFKMQPLIKDMMKLLGFLFFAFLWLPLVVISRSRTKRIIFFGTITTFILNFLECRKTLLFECIPY